jgi:Protein of unknown function (DUF4235)
MSRLATKIAYKPVGLLLSAGAGLAAGAIFTQVWKRVADDPDAPSAVDEGRGWAEVLTAAALQGAIFALVKAAVDRAGATGVKRITGHWPD